MKGTSMKKVLATLCSLILAGVMLSACANNSSGKVRIALIMSHMSNSFTTTLANSAKEQGAAAGVSVTVFDGKKTRPTSSIRSSPPSARATRASSWSRYRRRESPGAQGR